jgi:hypothetical protein
MRVEAKLEEFGLVLPEAPKLPPGVQVSFAWVRVYEDRAYIVGQGPLNPDGSIAQPLGKVGVAWLMVNGLVNAEPGFTLTTNVINGFSDLILELYGPEAGMHARMAPGLTTLPLGVPVTIAAEVAIRS